MLKYSRVLCFELTRFISSLGTKLTNIFAPRCWMVVANSHFLSAKTHFFFAVTKHILKFPKYKINYVRKGRGEIVRYLHTCVLGNITFLIRHRGILFGRGIVESRGRRGRNMVSSPAKILHISLCGQTFSSQVRPPPPSPTPIIVHKLFC